MEKFRLQTDIHPAAHRNLKIMAAMRGTTIVALIEDVFLENVESVAGILLGEAHRDLISQVFAADSPRPDRPERGDGV